MSRENTSISKVAKRYAYSIFALAKSEQTEKKLVAAFAALAKAIDANEDAMLLLRHPQIARSQKAALLQAIAKGADAILLRALEVIAMQGRSEFIVEIAAALEHLLHEESGEVEAIVTSATALSKEEEEAIAKAVSRYTGKHAFIKMKQDENLIGGFTVSVGSTLMDASLRSQLKKLEQHLTKQAS